MCTLAGPCAPSLLGTPRSAVRDGPTMKLIVLGKSRGKSARSRDQRSSNDSTTAFGLYNHNVCRSQKIGLRRMARRGQHDQCAGLGDTGITAGYNGVAVRRDGSGRAIQFRCGPPGDAVAARLTDDNDSQLEPLFAQIFRYGRGHLGRSR